MTISTKVYIAVVKPNIIYSYKKKYCDIFTSSRWSILTGWMMTKLV